MVYNHKSVHRIRHFGEDATLGMTLDITVPGCWRDVEYGNKNSQKLPHFTHNGIQGIYQHLIYVHYGYSFNSARLNGIVEQLLQSTDESYR